MNINEIKTEIADTIQTVRITHNRLIVDERNYEKLKHDYEIKVLKLKYSEEYSKYKTIKEREERAKIELAEQKKELLQYKNDIAIGKYDLEFYNLELRYLFRLYDEGVLDDG